MITHSKIPPSKPTQPADAASNSHRNNIKSQRAITPLPGPNSHNRPSIHPSTYHAASVEPTRRTRCYA